MANEFDRSVLSLEVQGVELDVAAIHRAGNLEPIVFLHGFGSIKEDYADIVRHSAFDGHPFLAYDAPGCGESRCADLSRVSIPFLVDVALAMLGAMGIERFHLVGHSMGGLTALMLADAHPGRVMSFVNIEGNIAPEIASSAARSRCIPRPITSASSTTSSSAHATHLPTPARCMRRACGTRSARRPFAESSSRCSSSPTTAA